MIPSLVVDEVRQSLVEYLASTFALADDDVREALSEFLQDQADGIFRGPYLRVRTPFASVDQFWRSPLDWMPENFKPHAHQASAFDRLGSRDSAPEPTIVTTGTGSGKTECFLYPILDHCARAKARGEAGIKALILYPMNALATDQANRIAEVIASNPELAGVTAGLYIGGEGKNSSMSPEHLIDQKHVLQANPPDILLTNYKMLDFLLLRRKDRDLWAVNQPDTLQYVVLDEFHTYDGAQGTDVAMLLRRVGRTLGMATDAGPLGIATPVATSATLASDPGALAELREFAAKVFGSEFDEDAVIGETRQSVDEVCSDIDFYLEIPTIADVLQADDAEEVAAAFCSRLDVDETKSEPAPSITDVVALGEVLLRHPLTRAVLAAVGSRPRSWRDAVEEIVRNAPDWGRTYMTAPGDVEKALGRFLWLISIARRDQGGRLLPLFNVEVQLWVREVSRLLRAVGPDPTFRWVDSASPDADPAAEHVALELPAVSCRRCGMAGWMAVHSELTNNVVTAPGTIYQSSVKHSPNIRTLIHGHPDDPAVLWFDPTNHCFVEPGVDGALPVYVTASDDDAKADVCPACGERDAIRFLGLRVASLTSVSINTIFASTHVEHEERKLLAFTDSVQDASHRASFFAGRTHRINLRVIMAQAIQDNESLTLADLGDELYLRAESPHERYGVVPPDLLKHPTVRTVWTERPDGGGLEVLHERLRFEADLEFGLRTRVGRTLELSNVAAAHVPLSDETLDLIGEDVTNLLGEVPEQVGANLEIWARGMIERLRLKGAIASELLDPYAESGGEQWLVWGGRPDGLPPFVPGIGRPTFATLAAKGDFDSLTAASKTPTWFADWAMRTLGVEMHVARDLNQRLFPLLANGTDMIRTWNSPSGKVFGLDRNAIAITDVVDLEEPVGLQCTVCGGRHVAPSNVLGWWSGTPCFRYRCPGTYQPHVGRETSYYRKLYRSGITRRVVTGEHTGLLDRQEREELEERFKKGTAPDDENVLTATPTLEMGIDIGALSAVLLTSVPRTPAAYLQRVGRAGRASGNSLVATFVPTDRHGLYYLAEPESMLAGDVRPPNCYLDAGDTLKRQYIAFLLDRVADLTIDARPMPEQIGALANKGLDENGLLRIIANASMNENTYVDEFLGLFGSHLATDTIEELRDFAAIGIETRLKHALEHWKDELRELSLRVKRLGTAVEKAEELAANSGDDTEFVNLLGQRRVITDAMHDKRSEYTLSALGRLGLLPNYTLIEDSVQLTATMWSRDENDEFIVDKKEYERSGSMAVREFAPSNSFYASGHRHVVDALEIGTADELQYAPWRLCPECGFAAPEQEGVVIAECPRCRESGIVDIGCQFQMLQLRQAYSSAPEEAARVFDETDDRRQERFEVITTVDVDPIEVQGAWRLAGDDSVAFGAELVPNTVLRTINLGFAERTGSTKIAVAGREQNVSGFTVCRHCGAASDARDDRKGTKPERLHQGWCKVRSGAISKKNAFDNIVLYHELVTDAVRMLLPVSMFEVGERLTSFKAALLLGLRKDFGGDPDHLRVALSDMPNSAGQGRRNFLVLYDRVPGGTGYLQRLADPERVREILIKGREVIARCICQSEGRNACHRCLLGVIDRHEYDLVNRDLALWLLDQLLDDWSTESIDTVAGIDLGRTEESELERRFKVALQDWCDRDDHDHLSLKPVPGKKGFDAFELRIGVGEGALRWRIMEQEGISTTPNTLPDFVIERLDERSKKIAVYLDGFQFHASTENPHMADDAAKRNGARREYIVWNMSWADVDVFHKATLNGNHSNVPPRALLEGTAKTKARAAHAGRGGILDYATVNQNPIELLLTYLANPDENAWRDLALSTVAGAFAGAGAQGRITASDARSTIDTIVLGESPQWTQGADFAIGTVAATVRGLSIGMLLRLDDPSAERWTVITSLPDDDASVSDVEHHRPRWQDWLQWANVLQFMEGPGRDVLITTTSSDHSSDAESWIVGAAEAGGGMAQPVVPEASVAVVSVDVSDEMEEELDLLEDEQVAAVVRRLLTLGAPDFVAGYELDGVALEAGWADAKIAIVPNDWDGETPTGWEFERPSTLNEDTFVEALRRSA